MLQVVELQRRHTAVPAARKKSSVTSSLQLLRAQTQVLHQALEATPMAQALLAPDLTLPRYADILAVWADGWQILEPALFAASFAATVPHLLPFPRSRCAQADLHYLASNAGLDHSNRSVQADSDAGATAAWAGMPLTLSGFIGVCYVLRGASLGGKVIARHLHRTLGLDAANGAAFFNAESGDGLSWVQWMGRAEQTLLQEDDIEAACQAAAETFALLLALFSVPQHRLANASSHRHPPPATR